MSINKSKYFHEQIYSIRLPKNIHKELTKLIKYGITKSDYVKEAIYEKMAREASKYKFKQSDTINIYSNDYIIIEKKELGNIFNEVLKKLKKI
jgi:predicted DNA-binding protein